MRLFNTRIRQWLGIVQKPHVLQMPITSRCNSRCKTCNVWKHTPGMDIDSLALRRALKDDFFSEVRTVGLNGGEFTLVPDFVDILEAVLTLPKISSVHLITNGLLPKRLFESLVRAKSICDRRGVLLYVCLSVDGVGEVHENVRGIPHCFEKTKEVLLEMQRNSSLYCHQFSVGCTLSCHNIPFIRETELFFQSFEGLNVEYHLAVPNKRIWTDDDYKGYYVLEDSRYRLIAAEFFYCKYRSANNERYRRQCFANYYFLKTNGGRNGGCSRLCTCDYLYRDVTIDEHLNIALCATHSHVVGNLNERGAKEIIHGKSTRRERKRIRREHCGSCIHYSYHGLSTRGALIYMIEEIRNRYVFRYYELRSQRRWIDRNLGAALLLMRIVYVLLRQVFYSIWRLR